MTDNEIIKALENCNLPKTALIAIALDLIKRQKAEIKKLMDMVGQNEGVLPEYEKILKSEAIKAFAEILKNKSELLAPSVYAEPFRAVSVEEIDNLVQEKINRLPSADMVEVVRCKDCKYYQTATVNEKGFLICSASGMEITEMDFCSYGERKKE